MVIEAIVDTGLIIDYLRYHPPAQAWFASQDPTRLGIIPVIWLEVIQGAQNKAERDRALTFLHRFRMEHPIPDDNRWAMRQLASFRLSHGVEFPDTMIASVAVRLAIPLYTLNIKHYAPLPNLDERQPY